jgi:hypothetical protein
MRPDLGLPVLPAGIELARKAEAVVPAIPGYGSDGSIDRAGGEHLRPN